MRRNNSVVLTAGAILACVWSCGENTEQIITTEIHDTVTVYADTLYDTLTEYDTVPVVVTRWDTMFVTGGRPTPILFGIVYDVSFLFDSTGAPAESLYAGFSCFSNPARYDLQTMVNADTLPVVENQSQYILDNTMGNVLYGDWMLGLNSAALMVGTLYENWVHRAGSYPLRIVVPVYPGDSLGAVTYDTISDTISIPRLADAFGVDAGSGPIAPSTGVLGSDTYYVVPGQNAVTLSWSDQADFYVVTVYKWILGPGSAEIAETPYDTIVAGPAASFAAGLFSIAPGSTVYDVAEIDVSGINGPVPGSWDTLPSFEGHGVLLGMTSDWAFSLIIPQGSRVLGKRLAAAGVDAADRPSPATVFKRALGIH